MRFDSLEEFLRHYYENGVSIADVEFTFATPTATDPAVNPDVVQEPTEVEPEGEEPQKLEEYVTICLPSGDIKVPLAEDGMMVVESLGMTPNACGAGFIVIEGRKVFLDMCEMDGRTVAYLPTTNGQRYAAPVRIAK